MTAVVIKSETEQALWVSRRGGGEAADGYGRENCEGVALDEIVLMGVWQLGETLPQLCARVGS